MITEAPAEGVTETRDLMLIMLRMSYDASGGDGPRRASCCYVDGRMGRDLRTDSGCRCCSRCPILLWSPIGREVIGFTPGAVGAAR